MKCWTCNKNNPANKGGSFNLDDFGNYGDVSSVVGMLTAISTVKKNKNKKKMKREMEKDNETNE